ncbi:MAG: GDSL-type esterase/lipase family protein [Muribaculaceae bacterium]|jgi:lysophospholipase L1-like esterase|nr:GDSL-type esterase/lipase family protein [Muribaculaceae bacterium]
MMLTRNLILAIAVVASSLIAQSAVGQKHQTGALGKAEHNVYYYQRSTLFKVLPVKSSDIVFFGDSQTDGCEWNELFSNPCCKNRGVNGDGLAGYIERIESVVAGHPRKIFILGGVNDIPHFASADTILANMDRLISIIKMKSPRTKIYLESLLPINNDFHKYKGLIGKEDMVLAVNRGYAKIAERQHVTFINLFPHFADAEGKLSKAYTNDGLHLLGDGYILLRGILKPYVK